MVERTRAEEFFYDTFDPASVVKISSALDRDGKISRWDYQVFAAGERGAATFPLWLEQPSIPRCRYQRWNRFTIIWGEVARDLSVLMTKGPAKGRTS
jgi:hypothetical protein